MSELLAVQFFDFAAHIFQQESSEFARHWFGNDRSQIEHRLHGLLPFAARLVQVSKRSQYILQNALSFDTLIESLVDLGW
jgi:hypothetical protein